VIMVGGFSVLVIAGAAVVVLRRRK
jgi:hypothetical protein